MNIVNTSHKSESYRGGKSATSQKTRPLVLIAEENQEIREKLRELIDLYDLQAVEAECGKSAVESAIAHCPDLIIMDDNLPGMGCFETMRLMRSISSLNIVPILLLSDYSKQTHSNPALAAECDDCFARPLDLGLLGKSLGKFLFLKGE
ncbi:MAG: response regulator [Acidobacteriota bacterium]|nr:response regulator [Acidobacteriota bacterium]